MYYLITNESVDSKRQITFSMNYLWWHIFVCFVSTIHSFWFFITKLVSLCRHIILIKLLLGLFNSSINFKICVYSPNCYSIAILLFHLYCNSFGFFKACALILSCFLSLLSYFLFWCFAVYYLNAKFNSFVENASSGSEIETDFGYPCLTAKPINVQRPDPSCLSICNVI